MMMKRLSETPIVIAPDGSEVRVLARTERGSMAHFSLPVGKVSIAVAHHSVDEVWFFISGQGQFWWKSGEVEAIVQISPGLSISIPVGTHFQFRNDGAEPLIALGTTMPPWPGADEAYAVEGRWPSSV